MSILHKFLWFFGVLFFPFYGYCQADYSIQGRKCLNEPLVFSNESEIATDSLLWDFGDGTGSEQDLYEYTFTSAGTYSVTLTVFSGGQQFTRTRDINIHNNPVAAFSDSSLVIASFARVFIDESSYQGEISSYVWDFGDNTPALFTDSAVVEYKYAKAGDYTVWHKVIDNNLCVDSVSRQITIEDIFSAPNVFTPNSDGINDEFIVTTNGVTRFSIDIFSRWGSLVFKREGHQQIIWDGRMPDGSMVTPGTYYFVITVLDTDKVYEPSTGFVTVFTDDN